MHQQQEGSVGINGKNRVGQEGYLNGARMRGTDTLPYGRHLGDPLGVEWTGGRPLWALLLFVDVRVAIC